MKYEMLSNTMQRLEAGANGFSFVTQRIEFSFVDYKSNEPGKFGIGQIKCLCLFPVKREPYNDQQHATETFLCLLQDKFTDNKLIVLSLDMRTFEDDNGNIEIEYTADFKI